MHTAAATRDINKYQRVLQKIISIGLLVFVNGFFCFPEISWVKSTFYLLVLAPGLVVLLIEARNFPFNDKFLLAFMALPFYLCLSHLWANDENITRGFFFFFKQVIFLFILVFCFWVAIKNNNKFLSILLISMLVTGSIFAFISITQHLFIYGNDFRLYSLKGFSTNDANKAAAMHAVHLTICIYFLSINIISKKSTSSIAFLILAIAIDGSLLILSFAKGPWLTITSSILIIVVSKIRQPLKIPFIITVGILITASISYFNIVDTLNNMTSYLIRVQLIRESILQMEGKYLYGLGLTYKLPVENTSLMHPHNIFIDSFRFGGLTGLALIILHAFSILWMQMTSIKRRFNCVLFLWFFTGVILLSLYGQQVLTRPGYIWFLYWIPAALTLSMHLYWRYPSLKTKN